MTSPHEQAARLLSQNLDVVRRFYGRGWFEHSVALGEDGVLRMPDSDPTLSPRQDPPPDANWRWCSLEDASDALNRQALDLLPHLVGLRGYADAELYADGDPSGGGVRKLWRTMGGFQNLVKAVYRAQVINYELRDAFLRLTAGESSTFRGYAAALTRGVKADSDNMKVGRNIGRLFKRQTSLPLDPDLSLVVTDEFLLLGLCGINSYYRQHSSDFYSLGLEQLGPLEQYIRVERSQSKGRESWGLRGLAAYLRGRLTFGLSRYAEARDAWTESSECYGRKIEQKLASLSNPDESQREKWEDTRSLCLRRSSLAAAMGNGYLLLVMSKLSASLEIVVLSRGVLTKHCGRVYAAYVDLIYAAAKRARYSSDLGVLEACEAQLKNCRKTFNDLVKGTHYVERANIEIALVFYYQARGLGRLEQQEISPQPDVDNKISLLYSQAVENLTSAINYAGFSENRRERNPRMLAEAYALRSHLWSHISDGPYELRCGRALYDANEALKHVGDMTQLECEARMALGAAYLAVAEGVMSDRLSPDHVQLPVGENASADRWGGQGRWARTRREAEKRRDARQVKKESGIWKYKQKADAELSQALELNNGANPRISAVCFLRLAQSALLLETTLPDAWFNFLNYQAIADRVEHAFCHDHAKEIEKELRLRGRHFFVDVRQGLKYEEWKVKLEEYLIHETINRIVEETPGPLAGGGGDAASQQPKRQGRKATYKTRLAKELEKYMDIGNHTAADIATAREQEFLAKLKAAGKYVDGEKS